MSTTIVKDRRAEIMRAMRALTKNDVYVGVPAENAAREEPGEKQPISNAAIGYINERGLPERNIPPRPHLVPGVRAVEKEIAKRLKTAVQHAFRGDLAQIDKAQNAVGLIAVNSVRKMIVDTLSPPLAPSTLYHRKHRKEAPRDGEQPLLDTGGYLKSITYVIRKR
ncbi:hypothetical protein [Methylosinus sp. Ce-a6]|uniref:hypothetical protein n=1 Tax=Methylosinus sp. Ce-a6 TaxID=2172005 RepID=UPI00135C53E9|nr:hypothetical protein [Methylosinus sp. Ce-a6]